VKTFDIGAGLTCDLDRLIDTRLLVQANSGGGKSWCVRRLLEQTHGHVQHLVIDPEGEFASLRERFDYVLAARHGGDTAADPRSAKLLAERLLELKVSAILDIYELKAHERIKFVRLFLEALVDAPKSLWHPAIVVVDEAHVYCPQKGEAESAAPVIDLATRGRKRGFCAVLATQRLSKLHKDAAAECNNKLIGRTALDVDMDRAADELGMGKADRQGLRDLDPGEFFGFGPAFGGKVARVHVGTVQTTHPKAGGRLAFTAPPPTSKVRALLPKLADLPAEVVERERSLSELQKELAHTKRELTLARKAQPGPAPVAAPKIIERFVLKDGHVSRIEKATDALSQMCCDVLAAVRKVQIPAPASMRQPVTIAARAVTPRRPMPRTVVPTGDEGALSGPEQRIVDAIAWLEALGIREAEQTAVAFLANYTYGAGSFNNPKGSLRGKGYVEYLAGNRIRLTDEGRALAQIPDEALTPEELHARVLDRLPGPEQRLLRPLLDAYPDALSNQALADAAGYTAGAGSFNNPRGRLRSLGLIDYNPPGHCVAKSLLFLE
jgi:hypothetical protein